MKTRGITMTAANAEACATNESRVDWGNAQSTIVEGAVEPSHLCAAAFGGMAKHGVFDVDGEVWYLSGWFSWRIHSETLMPTADIASPADYTPTQILEEFERIARAERCYPPAPRLGTHASGEPRIDFGIANYHATRFQLVAANAHTAGADGFHIVRVFEGGDEFAARPAVWTQRGHMVAILANCGHSRCHERDQIKFPETA